MPAIGPLEAAKAVCRLSDWSLSNLELQKILYIAQLRHFREHRDRLIDTSFQAWDYGPVSETVYHRVKAFGSDPIRNVFMGVKVPVGSRLDELEGTYELLEGKTSTELVYLTHRPGGAWSQFYRPGARGIIIPDSAIVNESRTFATP